MKSYLDAFTSLSICAHTHSHGCVHAHTLAFKNVADDGIIYKRQASLKNPKDDYFLSNSLAVVKREEVKKRAKFSSPF
jgi:hypothetical protein